MYMYIYIYIYTFTYIYIIIYIYIERERERETLNRSIHGIFITKGGLRFMAIPSPADACGVSKRCLCFLGRLKMRLGQLRFAEASINEWNKHGFPWIPMDSHGFPWIPMSQWISGRDGVRQSSSANQGYEENRHETMLNGWNDIHLNWMSIMMFFFFYLHNHELFRPTSESGWLSWTQISSRPRVQQMAQYFGMEPQWITKDWAMRVRVTLVGPCPEWYPERKNELLECGSHVFLNHPPVRKPYISGMFVPTWVVYDCFTNIKT